MTTDTPESVNTAAAFLQDLTLLPDVFRVGTINDLNSTAQMLTRYADLLDQRARKQDGTHSIECWRWHHDCAIARIEAVKRRLIEDRYGSSYYDISSAINGTSA